jgi:hypothetical protein
MIAGPFISQSTVDDDKVWRWSRWYDLSSGSQADQKLTTAREHVFRYKNREWRANRATHNASGSPGQLESIKLRVVARPAVEWP